MIRKGYVDCSGGQLHYRTNASRGASAKPVIFFHQTASSGRMWERVIAAMDGHGPFYAFDTPGFGGSFDPSFPPDISHYARWFLEGFDALGIYDAHFVGHHTGAAIALDLAVHNAGRTSSITLIGPNPLTLDEREAFAAKLGSAFRPTRSGAYLLKNWEYLRVGGADADILLLHAEMVDMLRGWAARPHAYSAVWRQDALSLLPQVKCPVLMMAAPDDILFPYLDRARAACPTATLATLSGGANFEPDLVPLEVAQAIAAHIDRVTDTATRAAQ